LNADSKIIMLLAVSVLALGFLNIVKGQDPQGTMQAFLDSTIFEIRIQASATAQVQPTENVTIILTLTSQAETYVKFFNLSVFGFLNGTERVLMANASDSAYWLNTTSRAYNYTFPVPEWVSGWTYGEVQLANSVEQGMVTIRNEGFVCGFYMTNVENVYLEGLEHDFSALEQNYTELGQKLNATLQANSNQLDSTRTVAGVLGVTTVVFVATTMYLVLRKPKQYW